MRDKRLNGCALSILMTALFLASCVLPVSAQNKSKRPRYTVPANTTIRLRLNQDLSSKTAQVGDTFTSTVVDPVYVRGAEVIPAGSIVGGHITQVRRASRKSQAGSINAAFNSVETPKNVRYVINGSLTSADNEGGVKGRSSKKRNAAFIGGGVVVGAIFNGAAGAATGGAIGVARGLIQKGQDAEVKPGTEFNIILNQSVLMYAFR